jgi:hypothetical protein
VRLLAMRFFVLSLRGPFIIFVQVLAQPCVQYTFLSLGVALASALTNIDFTNIIENEIPLYLISTGSSPTNEKTTYYVAHFLYIINLKKGIERVKTFNNLLNSIILLSASNTEVPDYVAKIGLERMFDPFNPDVGRRRFTVRTLTKNETFF